VEEVKIKDREDGEGVERRGGQKFKLFYYIFNESVKYTKN